MALRILRREEYSNNIHNAVIKTCSERFLTHRNVQFNLSDPAQIFYRVGSSSMEEFSSTQCDPFHGYPNPVSMTNFVYHMDHAICFSEGLLWVLNLSRGQWIVMRITDAPTIKTKAPLCEPNTCNDLLEKDRRGVALTRFSPIGAVTTTYRIELPHIDEERTFISNLLTNHQIVNAREIVQGNIIEPEPDYSNYIDYSEEYNTIQNEVAIYSDTVAIDSFNTNIPTEPSNVDGETRATFLSKFMKNASQAAYTLATKIGNLKIRSENNLETVIQKDKSVPELVKTPNQVEEASVACKICYSDEIVSRSVIDPCGHSACTKCIEEWAERSDECPFCRTTINKHFKLFD